MNINIENYYTARKNIFERFHESSTITKIVFLYYAYSEGHLNSCFISSKQ